MIIGRIELTQFRNYEQQVIDVCPGINVFYGDNAQGKTNILEAVYLCACARSHRTARDADMIRHQQDRYGVRIAYTNQNGSADEIEISYLEAVPGDPQRQRSMRIVRHNGSRLDRIGDLMGLFHAVIFAPEDLMLVKEGPATRRRYLDLLISQVRPSYFLALQQYSRQLQQRNRFLKDLRTLSGERSGAEKRPAIRKAADLSEEQALQLDVWDLALAEQAAILIEQRIRFSERIGEIAGQAQEKISMGQEKLYMRYRTIAGIKPGMDREQMRRVYYHKLKKSFQDDFEKGTTGNGPHRDDLELSLDGEGLRPFASQGQQRSAVLALKLAELAILREDTGEAPVLLLDDVMSELDEGRRASLLDSIMDAQVFVTCTDARQVTREFQREKSLLAAADDQTTNLDENKSSGFMFFQVLAGQVERREMSE